MGRARREKSETRDETDAGGLVKLVEPLGSLLLLLLLLLCRHDWIPECGVQGARFRLGREQLRSVPTCRPARRLSLRPGVLARRCCCHSYSHATRLSRPSPPATALVPHACPPPPPRMAAHPAESGSGRSQPRPEGPIMTSDELDWLVYSYLEESGPSPPPPPPLVSLVWTGPSLHITRPGHAPQGPPLTVWTPSLSQATTTRPSPSSTSLPSPVPRPPRPRPRPPPPSRPLPLRPTAATRAQPTSLRRRRGTPSWTTSSRRVTSSVCSRRASCTSRQRPATEACVLSLLLSVRPARRNTREQDARGR